MNNNHQWQADSLNPLQEGDSKTWFEQHPENHKSLSFIFWGVILTFFLKGIPGMVLDLIGAILIVFGTDKLVKENAGNSAFFRARQGAFLLSIVRALVLVAEILVSKESVWRLVVSFFFMVPDLLALTLVLYSIGSGICHLEQQHGADFGGQKLLNRAKQYSIAIAMLIVIEMSLIMGMGGGMFAMIGLFTSIVSTIILVIYLYRLYRTQSLYAEWRNAAA